MEVRLPLPPPTNKKTNWTSHRCHWPLCVERCGFAVNIILEVGQEVSVGSQACHYDESSECAHVSTHSITEVASLLPTRGDTGGEPRNTKWIGGELKWGELSLAATSIADDVVVDEHGYDDRLSLKDYQPPRRER